MALGKTGDRAGAVANFRKALQIFAELTAKDPTNADFRRQWAVVYLYFSRFQAEIKETERCGRERARMHQDRGTDSSPTAPTNASAQNTFAQLYTQLGASRVALAAKASATKQIGDWRAAKDVYQKAFEIYRDMKNKGTLSGADAKKPDEVAGEIAKCDAALAH